MQESPLLVTTDEAAQRLGVGRTMVFKLISRGDLESVKVGRLRRVPADAISDYVQRLRDHSTTSDSVPVAIGAGAH
jgi:excisionase family DNA binding protein